MRHGTIKNIVARNIDIFHYSLSKKGVVLNTRTLVLNLGIIPKLRHLESR